MDMANLPREPSLRSPLSVYRGSHYSELKYPPAFTWILGIQTPAITRVMKGLNQYALRTKYWTFFYSNFGPKNKKEASLKEKGISDATSFPLSKNGNEFL